MNPFGLLVVAIGVILLVGGAKAHSKAKAQPSGKRTTVPQGNLPSSATSPYPHGVKGKYTAPPLPSTKTYGGSPGTFTTPMPPGGYTTKVPPSQTGG